MGDIMKKLLASIILSVLLFTTYAFAHEYEDVQYGSEYYYAVEYLRRNDVFKDTRLFNPDIIIHKAEFIKYLVLLNSPDFQPERNITLPFEDTYDNAWYAPYLHEAIKLGIIFDWETKIEPYDKLSLIDALQLMFHSASIPIPRVYKGTIPYVDVERNERFAPLIMRALEFDLFEPQRIDYAGIYRRLTRAEAARIIYKMDLMNLTSPTRYDDTLSFDSQLEKVVSTWDLIFSNYVNQDELNKYDISDAAIRAMMETLDDPYSAYLDAEENEAFSGELDGEIEGIGAVISVNDDDEIMIISPLAGSPAEAAGIKAGDIIIKVDGVDITDMNLYETINLIRGPKGSTVKLTIRRNGASKIIEIVRDVIKINALDYEVQSGGKVMVIKLYQFSQNAVSEFREVVEIIQNNSDIKGVIIDVRDNPGGLLDSAVRIMNYLLKPDSEIVTIQYNYFSYTQYARGLGELAGYPMVVLINEASASASEILAGALKDFGLAKIIGKTSFGKGSVQELNYFIDNSSLKLTVAKWLTPLNHDIEENGIAPDITVTDNPNTTADEQMDRALTEINRMIR
jgi:carboxyl-terminal processing protease